MRLPPVSSAPPERRQELKLLPVRLFLHALAPHLLRACPYPCPLSPLQRRPSLAGRRQEQEQNRQETGAEPPGTEQTRPSSSSAKFDLYDASPG
jgi:hypothetical protein